MNQIETYDPSFFGRLKKAEESYFWFKVRRKWIYDKIRKFIVPPASVLEVGCGTGNVSNFLSQRGYSVTGCEYYRTAINLAWPGFKIVQGDANSLPFKDSSFDVVGLFDVIEHFEDDSILIKEASRVTKNKGVVAVTVPAREELWSSYDDLALHKRRYTKERLEQVFLEVKLNPLLIEYLFMSLYFPMKYMRREGKISRTELFRINKYVNNLLKGLLEAERFISKGLPLPIGTSIIAVARKDL